MMAQAKAKSDANPPVWRIVRTTGELGRQVNAPRTTAHRSLEPHTGLQIIVLMREHAKVAAYRAVRLSQCGE